ncbi:site-specific DNA-methyltransferase [Gemmiger formicilis]|jgi:adenine-specific DNA-methyltransferase|uniref:site-specific DNA-methyltransferase n=1 Tax=Gemmiger formicilis TaxID=745368 RepID=UPI001C03962A|nr:site-specific DNA-methyltransferase [Gemmiger formicilis]MBT9674767.1 site-specific DNA-methyltransferase [Gemmiger formicilis]
MDKVKMTTPDGVAENIEKLAALFPAAVTEMRGEDGTLRKGIDFEKLKQLLSRDIVEGGERYEFSWVGKKAAMAEAARPTTETLRPVKADSRNWDTTENLYIEGDNLAALKILQESYLGKVKMIYIDPPYNTGKNYIYRNDFSLDRDDYYEQAGEISESGSKLVSNPRTYGRFHSAWLTMFYERILLARNLLRKDGVLVVAIDENEQASLETLLKEVFSESVYDVVSVPVVHNPRGVQGKNFSYIHEFAIFVFPNSIKAIADKKIPEDSVTWSQFRNWGTESERTDAKNCFYPVVVKDDTIIGFGSVTPNEIHPCQTEKHNDEYWVYPIDKNGIERKWRYARQSVDEISNMLRAKKTSSGYEIEIGKTFGVQKTIWIDKRYDANEYGTKIVGELVPGGEFSFPKSLWTVYDAVVAATSTEKECTILDFFSGSATTAHAVMQLNAEDSGHRKFIMVQLPEPCDEKSEAYKAGYKNICEIGKERIRRAGDKIKTEHPDADLDIGFRVFRVDSSNMRDVYYKPEEFTQTMLGEAVSNIKPDRTDLDLLYACLLDCGVPIHLPHTTTTVDGCTIHNVDNGALMACFDEHIPHSVIRTMAAEAPLQVIFRDSAFAADADKINVTEIFKNLSPDTKVRVI